jgi:hypothetical protein
VTVKVVGVPAGPVTSRLNGPAPPGTVNGLPGTPSLPGQPAVGNLVATPGAGKVDLSWTAPSGAGATATPTGYQVRYCSPAATCTLPGPADFTTAGLTQSVTGLTPGTPYLFQVLATYAAPNFGTPATVQAAPGSSATIQQQISVTRPQGALILTQRCGVNGAMNAWGTPNAFPGYPGGVPGRTASADQVGTSPDTDLTTPGVQPDPQFPAYPYPAPAVYPTSCGVSLGTAAIVSSGPLTGQYYKADGYLNQVTVSDARDVDSGWRLNASMAAFSSGTDSFSGNYLGWKPQVTSDSAVSPDGYDQTVSAGPEVLPGTGVGTAADGLGTAPGNRMATALAGQGLGVASMDAQLALLIPISANFGNYTGTFTFDLLDTGV